MVVLKGLSSGRIEVPAAQDVSRAWACLPDMTRAAAALADKRGDLADFTDMPFAGFTLTMGGLKTELEAIPGHSLNVRRFPWWAMTLASPFWELARELREMRYLYDLPHSLDPAPMASLLPDLRMTPLVTVLSEHVQRLVQQGGSQGSAMVTQTGR
jgi:hypothetical protein